jgi:hypothetical protein
MGRISALRAISKSVAGALFAFRADKGELAGFLSRLSMLGSLNVPFKPKSVWPPRPASKLGQQQVRIPLCQSDLIILNSL